MSRDLTFDGSFEHLYVMTQSTVSARRELGPGCWKGPWVRPGPYVGEPLVFGLLALYPLCCHSFSRFLWPPVLSTWTVYLVLLTGTHTVGGVCSLAGQCSPDS